MKTPLLFAGPLFFALSPAGLAQTTELPAEAVLEFVPAPPRVSRANPVQATLTATILPVGRGSRARGELIFIPGGDQVMVLGRIRGLERNRRYEWILLPAGATQGRGEALGMWTTDSSGLVLVDTILPRTTLARFPQGLLGGTVLIRRAPPLDPPAARPTVASGEIHGGP